MRFICSLLVLGLALFFARVGHGDEPKKDVRFFRFDALSVNQEFVFEEFDLGEINAGEQIKIQVYVRNRTKKTLVVKPDSSCSELSTNSESVTIEPEDGALLNIALTVPKTPNDLRASYRWEAMLTNGCRFVGFFKSKLLQGVVSFATNELTFEFAEDYDGKVTIPIPVILSNVEDVGKLQAICSDSISFLSVLPVVVDGKPLVLASFFPKALDRSQYRGQIFLENKELSTSCVVNLTLTRKVDFSIFPKRITFKQKPGSTELAGEAILRCKNATSKIESITLECEPSNNDGIKCEVKKICDQMGRIYFGLERNSRPDINNEVLILLIKVNDGTRVQTMFLPTFIAN